MRVLLVNKFWYPKGGAERYTFLLRDLLEARGDVVIPFAMEDERNEPTPWAEHFLPHVDFWDAEDAVPNATRALERLSQVLWNRDAATRIGEVLDEAKPDIVHLQNFAHQISPAILPVIAERGIPIVWTLHDYKAMCPNYRMYTEGAPCERCNRRQYWNAVVHNCMGSLGASAAVALEMTLHHAILDVYGKHLAAVIAPSAFMAGRLRAWGWEGRIEVIPNFVPALPARIPTDGDRVVLSVGRLAEEKGIADLLEAAQRSPEVPFVIIGDGPLRAQCELRAAQCVNVQYRGPVAPVEVQRAIGAAAIVVVPSRWYENAPYVVLEAMAAGVPVIASDIGGLPELVRHGETGLLVPPANAAALDKTVAMLYRDRNLCAELGARAREVAAMEYAPARHDERLGGLYRELVSHQRTA